MPTEKYLPTQRERALGLMVQQHTSSDSFAWLCADRVVYFAESPLSPGAPSSPVVDLIQGIHGQYPDFARAILRRRIFTSYSMEDLDRAFVKVAAKKCTKISHDPEDIQGTLSAFKLIDMKKSARDARLEVLRWHKEKELTNRDVLAAAFLEGDGMNVAMAWSRQGLSSEQAYRSDRGIGAALLDRDGKILLGASNRSGLNRSLHAEVNLVQMWYAERQAPLPIGSRICVTLQSCRMCAALLVHCSEDPSSLSVQYLQSDPGRFAQQTALQRLGLEAKYRPMSP